VHHADLCDSSPSSRAAQLFDNKNGRPEKNWLEQPSLARLRLSLVARVRASLRYIDESPRSISWMTVGIGKCTAVAARSSISSLLQRRRRTIAAISVPLVSERMGRRYCCDGSTGRRI